MLVKKNKEHPFKFLLVSVYDFYNITEVTSVYDFPFGVSLAVFFFFLKKQVGLRL